MQPLAPEPAYETLKAERDALLTIVGQAQADAKAAERVIELLIVAGHVSPQRVSQARALASL